MRKLCIALGLCTVVAGGLLWGTTAQTHAAMVIGDGKANMSLIETARKKSCWMAFICVECCKSRGKESCRVICK
jgi:hypothetical protein